MHARNSSASPGASKLYNIRSRLGTACADTTQYNKQQQKDNAVMQNSS
jgi:hypothetical protein